MDNDNDAMEWLMDEHERCMFRQEKREKENTIKALNEHFKHVILTRDETLLEFWIYDNRFHVMDLEFQNNELVKILVKYLYNTKDTFRYERESTIHRLNVTVLQLLFTTVEKEHELYLQGLVDIFKSVVNQTNVPYWDDNVFGIISNYTCMPYF
jgi:hypothetical protein